MNTTESAGFAARTLYHEVWRIVAAHFFAVERLTEWRQWEHKFDAEIVDESSSLACARLMLASLNDSYTEIVEVKSSRSADVKSSPVGAASEAVAVAVDSTPSLVTSFLTPTGIGYIRVLSFDHSSVADEIALAAAKIADCRGLLLDLRYNSGGRMDQALEACGLFIDNGQVATIERRAEGCPSGVVRRQYFLNEEQSFSVETLPSGAQPAEFYHRRRPLLAGKPLVILINRRTASAAELFVVALVQNGIPGLVCMVGGDTAGKGIGQVIFDLPGTAATLSITSSHWFAPGGEWLGDCGQTERDPITPDIVVVGDSGPEGLQIGVDRLKEMFAFAA